MSITTEKDLIQSLTKAAVSMEDVTIARAVRDGISVNLGQTYYGFKTWTLTNSAGRQAVITYRPMNRRYEIVIDGFEEEDAMYGTVSHITEHPVLAVAIAHAASKLR